MTKLRSSLSVLALVGMTLTLASAPTAAATRQKLADFSAGGTEAVWTPLLGDYDHLVLDVTGPEGVALRQEFPAGQMPFLGLFDPQGALLPDGLYKFELTLVPSVDRETRERMEEARKAGDSVLEALRDEGALPAVFSRQTGFFTIADGSFVNSDLVEPAAVATGTSDELYVPNGPEGVVITNADGVIRNSLCVGFDCPNSPTFSDSTILLMENNTRIKFGDTSSINAFPRNDWEIEANSNLNGGANYLGFNDCGTNDQDGGCATDLVFAVEAGVRSSALYVESDGDVGFGTSNPVVELHAVRGDTPTLRLEQDGSSGFAPQTWDVAGNESSFFIRDATNGSTLPFRIFPGAASQSLVIDGDDEVGIGAGTNPTAPLHVRRSNQTARVLVEDTTTSAGNQVMLELTKGTAAPIARFNSQFRQWDFTAGNSFTLNDPSDAPIEMSLNAAGDLTITGSLVTGGGGACDPGPCDGVFSPEYEVESIEEHAEYMWEKRHLWGVGPTPEGAPINLTQKTTGILHELEKAHIYIEQLHGDLEEKDSEIDALSARLARLEALLTERPES